jgi:hypothetical protein
MKKALLIVVATFSVLCGAAMIAAWFYLPALAFHMLGKAIDGTVEASSSSVSFRGGLLVLKLNGVRVKGKVEGVVRTAELRVQPSKGLYVKYFTISDFDIRIGKEKGHIGFFPVPVELAEIRKGTVEYGGHKYVLREMRVTNFNTGGRLEFSIDGGVEGLGNLKSRGEGIFGDKRSDIKGEYFLSGVNMAGVFKNYEGLADSTGFFSFRDGVLVMDGDVQAPYFSLTEDFLKHRLVSERNACRIHLSRVGDTTDVTLAGLSFKGTPLVLKFSGTPRRLTYLELTTGFLAIPDLIDYINPAVLSEGDWGPLSFVKDGTVRIGRFVFRRGKPITAEIEVADVEAGSGRVAFRGVKGFLRLDGNALALSDFEGRLGEGRVSGVTGLVPLRLDRDVVLKGRYVLGLRDLSRLAGTDDAEILAGITEGDVRLHGRQGRGFSVEGAGTIRDSRFVWKRVALGASGSYTFKDGRVTFAPLVISEAGTRLVMRGSAEKERADLQVKGVIDGRQIGSVLDRPYLLDGYVSVDGEVGVEYDTFAFKGRLSMTDLSFEIPRLMKKGRGVESSAVVSLHSEAGGDFCVDSLLYTLGPLEAALSARVGKGRISHMHVVLDVPKAELLSRLFFFNDGEVRGNLKADLRVEDLPYPVVKLPMMRGHLTFHGDILHPPSLAKALTGIDLVCAFEGERSTFDLSGLRVGESVLTKARLVITGLDAPQFNLRVDMDSFDPADFAGTYRKRFRVPVIAAGSLMARTTGEFLLKSKTVRLSGMACRDLVMGGTFGHRRLAVTQGRIEAGKGELMLTGDAYLGSVPRVNVMGRLSDVTAREVLALFGGKQDIFEGAGSMWANLRFAGRDSDALAKSASGTVSLASRDGVIMRWNVLSKILALTNVYDLFRGRVDLTREGLVYKRLSASFDGNNGVFHTNDFLIDSPSMLITGMGDLDVGEKEIDGKMTVSPFVATDKIIDLIPLVRSIIRERKSGVLFFVYDIKGPAQDPEVKSSYVRSVGARIVYLLRNTFQLPKGVWDELQKELQK